MSDSTWTDDLSLGVDAIDREHHLQVDLLDEVVTSLDRARPAAEVVEVLERLIEYTNAHFLAEQLMMRLHGYPLYQAHVAEHDELLAEVRTLRDAVAGGDEATSRAVAATLRTWLTTHMRGMDRTYADYVAQPGVTPAV